MALKIAREMAETRTKTPNRRDVPSSHTAPHGLRNAGGGRLAALIFEERGMAALTVMVLN